MSAGYGYRFNSPPEALVDRNIETLTMVWGNLPRGDSYDFEWGILKEYIKRIISVELQTELERMTLCLPDDGEFEFQVWNYILDELVRKGWAIYDSDEITYFWAPGAVLNFAYYDETED